jgi:two-component system NtrC family sensor kinase
VTDAALPALTLYRLSKLVSASLDLNTTLEAIVDAAHQLIGAESTAILLQEDGDHLVIRVGRGSAANTVGERVPIGAGIVGRALIEGRPVRIDDMLTETGRARPDLDARSGIRSYLAVPLVWRGDTLGVVTVAALQPGVFGEAETTLAGEFAEQAAVAVAHARAFTEESARRAQLESMNLALQRAQQHLVQVEKLTAIGQLAHGIAHELNTPLGVIVSNLSVLSGYGESLGRLALVTRAAAAKLHEGHPQEAVAELLDAGLKVADLDYILEDLPALTTESTASANRIAEIVRSVALFAQGDAQRLVPVNVEDALQSAITLAWNELKHRATLERKYAGVPPVIGSSSELAQVFVHLLLNAAQALPERGGVVSVTTTYADGGVTIRIADNGGGIPLENLSRVFEPFFTTRAVGEGIGLGLSICHGIITRHQGTIDVQSVRGSGTTVTVRLAAAHSLWSPKGTPPGGDR